jgi:hypothetical protein
MPRDTRKRALCSCFWAAALDNPNVVDPAAIVDTEADMKQIHELAMFVIMPRAVLEVFTILVCTLLICS